MKTITIIALIAIVTSVSLLMSGSTGTSFANKKNDPQDDKNKPTFPGCEVGSSCQSDQAQENTFSNCDKHGSSSQSGNVPAQCQ